MAKVTSKVKKQVVLTIEVLVDGQHIRTAQCTVDSENPKDISKNPPYAVNGESSENLYKENRAEIRKVEAQFEDECYALQDEMIAEKEAK